jgi:hypothetical protein
MSFRLLKKSLWLTDYKKIKRKIVNLE